MSFLFRRNVANSFSDDCILYAPLTYGDLTNHITGANPITEGSCSVVWDSEHNAYSLTSGAVWKAALQYENLNISRDDVIEGGCTLSLYMNLIHYYTGHNSNNYISWISLNGVKNSENDQSLFFYVCKARMTHAFLTNVWHRVTVVWKDRKVYYYCDGVLESSASWYKDTMLGFQKLVTVCELHKGCDSSTICAKNVIGFKRALTDAEVLALNDIDSN